MASISIPFFPGWIFDKFNDASRVCCFILFSDTRLRKMTKIKKMVKIKLNLHLQMNENSNGTHTTLISLRRSVTT